ncbi:hypothetical protein [Streptomyces althioticus]|uniref:hypothetical protein n=1 Tax=Streptomyces althioticus TaxID=83380 RepID=UPI0033C3237C
MTKVLRLPPGPGTGIATRAPPSASGLIALWAAVDVILGITYGIHRITYGIHRLATRRA